MFQTNDIEYLNKTLPFGIYTIPEVSMVGVIEEECSTMVDEYATGYGYCNILPKGQLLGSKKGMLKIK